MGRLKTGTPPRIDRTSIDRSQMIEQPPSPVPLPFAFNGAAIFAGPQLPCYLVPTSERTHQLVRDNLHRSPLYGLDLIRGIGPRYCPSIEDKVVKFAHHASHQLFIEPEGWDEPTYYVGGFSTSLPAEVQLEMLRTLPGCQDVEMLRAGYAVEYDFVQPTELWPSLETRRIGGLFHGGQLNGTSGYEEAAAQGLVAGINAARRAAGDEALVLKRSGSYIGTLLDDLTTKGVDEPYRMLTSRAEHRVVLRHDNADTRLTPIGRSIGLVDDRAWAAFQVRQTALGDAIRRADLVRAPLSALPRGTTVAAALRRPEVHFDAVAPALPDVPAAIGERLEIELKSAGYAARARIAIDRGEREGNIAIPASLDVAAIGALSREAREKLAQLRPATLGTASRIAGVTPADLAILTVHVHRAVRQPA